MTVLFLPSSPRFAHHRIYIFVHLGFVVRAIRTMKQSMYFRNFSLVSALARAVRMWARHNKDLRETNRSLSREINVDTGEYYRFGLLPLLVSVLCRRASGLILAQRELRGLKTLEESPEFWLSKESPDEYVERLSRAYGEVTIPALQHKLRYEGFVRYDAYVILNDGPELNGGVTPDVGRKLVGMFHSVFKRPRCVKFRHEGEAYECVLSIDYASRFVESGSDSVVVLIDYKK